MGKNTRKNRYRYAVQLFRDNPGWTQGHVIKAVREEFGTGISWGTSAQALKAARRAAGLPKQKSTKQDDRGVFIDLVLQSVKDRGLSVEQAKRMLGVLIDDRS